MIMIKISWRNIWRNPLRSFTMIIAIMAGLWGGLFAASLAGGLISQRFKTGVEQEFSHLQIHDPEFIIEHHPQFVIEDAEKIARHLNQDKLVRAYSARSMVNGMLASANLTNGVNVRGIDPEMETATTGLGSNIVAGEYLSHELRNPVLIGHALATRMKVEPGSRVVLTFQDLNNELVSVACRVAGIFRTANSMFDEQNIYMMHRDLNALLGRDEIVNEIAIVLEDLEQADAFAQNYRELFPQYTTRTWAELSPQMALYTQMGMTMFMVILFIILLALAFGLLNTMLMSVFERVKELGMLMSIGMSKGRVFSMILFETIFLTLTGASLGMLLGWATTSWLGNRGMNLAVVGGDSLESFGFEAMIYPELEPSFYAILTLLVIFTALATAIYPALKALRLRPAEAVRAE
ncbi:MAG: ABC transporter permease [Bacteroidales bacterium]